VKTTSQAQAEAALRTFVKEDFSLPLWLSEAVPNKTTREVWWRSYWLEYDPVRGRVHRYCWLGSNATTGRDEALKRLRQLRAGRSLTPPLRVEQRERVHFRDEIEWVVRRVRSHSRIGEPYTVRHLSRFFEDIGRRAGIKTHCHALRHSAATAMFTHGAPIRELQELLGHSSVSTTASTYLHSSTNDLMEVHRKFHPREENGNGKEA
jgi:site-specific recombinase XerD